MVAHLGDLEKSRAMIWSSAGWSAADDARPPPPLAKDHRARLGRAAAADEAPRARPITAPTRTTETTNRDGLDPWVFFAPSNHIGARDPLDRARYATPSACAAAGVVLYNPMIEAAARWRLIAWRQGEAPERTLARIYDARSGTSA